MKFRGFLLKSGVGCTIDGVSQLSSLLCCRNSELQDAKLLFEGGSKLLHEFYSGHLARAYVRFSFLFGTMEFVQLYPAHAPHRRRVCIAIRTLVGTDE